MYLFLTRDGVREDLVSLFSLFILMTGKMCPEKSVVRTFCLLFWPFPLLKP